MGHYYHLITFTLLLALVSLKNNECVFEDYMTCVQAKDCCRVQLNSEFLCLSKQHLWYNYLERFEERYKDSDKNVKNDILNFNYREGQNMCVKWKEINSPFFTEFNISYTCECNSTWLVGLSVGIWVSLLSFLF